MNSNDSSNDSESYLHPEDVRKLGHFFLDMAEEAKSQEEAQLWKEAARSVARVLHAAALAAMVREIQEAGERN